MSPPDLLASEISMALLLERVVPVASAKYWRALSRGTLKLIFALSFLSSFVNGPYSRSDDISIDLVRVMPLRPASAMTRIKCGMWLSMASLRLHSRRETMDG